jgi:outer membrane lipopolysaccharide assembly protein LptE/RlpB
MKSLKRFILLLCTLFLLLSGCDRPFQHPTKSPNQWSDDHAQCEKMVRDALRNSSDANDPMFEARLINTCMKKKGWRKR